MEVLVHKETVVHVVFSDIEMPGAGDGFGLAKWIRAHRIVLLAGTVPRAIESAKELCEQGPVSKPYDPQFVHNHIRRLLAARQVAGKSPKLPTALRRGRAPEFRLVRGLGTSSWNSSVLSELRSRVFASDTARGDVYL